MTLNSQFELSIWTLKNKSFSMNRFEIEREISLSTLDFSPRARLLSMPDIDLRVSVQCEKKKTNLWWTQSGEEFLNNYNLSNSVILLSWNLEIKEMLKVQ